MKYAKKSPTHVFCLVGKVLCGCGGAIVGFIIGGPIFVILGSIVGLVTAQAMQGLVARPSI